MERVQEQVQPELRVPYAVDVPCGDVENYAPDDPTTVGLLVTAAIGPKEGLGAEVFDFFVCTPRWLAANFGPGGYEWGRNKLIVPRWDFDVVVAAISDLCASVVSPDWDSVATRLARYGSWEFEDAPTIATRSVSAG